MPSGKLLTHHSSCCGVHSLRLSTDFCMFTCAWLGLSECVAYTSGWISAAYVNLAAKNYSSPLTTFDFSSVGCVGVSFCNLCGNQTKTNHLFLSTCTSCTRCATRPVVVMPNLPLIPVVTAGNRSKQSSPVVPAHSETAWPLYRVCALVGILKWTQGVITHEGLAWSCVQISIDSVALCGN